MRTGNWVFIGLAMSASLAGQTAAALAQTPEPDPHAAQPQRPTVATHAGTVATGWLEIEAGTELDRNEDGSRSGLAPLLAKVGVAHRLQLELQAPIVRPADGSPGVGDASIGLKWRFLEDAPVVGDVAILPSVKLPTGSSGSGTGTGTTDVNLLFISSHTLGSVAMDLNFGYTRRRGDESLAPRSATLWTASFGGPARGQLGWVAELYGYGPTTGPAGAPATVAFLAGPTVMVRAWLVFDAGFIVPISGPQPQAFYAGVVYNIGRVWR
jgi:hypothetical protein